MPDPADLGKANVVGIAASARPIVDLLPPKLIGSVTVQPSTVQPGQSVLIEVLDTEGKSLVGSSTVVTINGVPAARRYLQFTGVGTYSLQIRAAAGTRGESATAKVIVAGAPLTFRRTLTASAVTLVPKLQFAQTLANHYLATFTLGVSAPAPISATAKETPPKTAVAVAGESVKMAADSKSVPQATSYKWTFGDGTTTTTQAPAVTHDYFPAIQAGIISHSFDITCAVVHDNVTVTRTLVLHSAYGLCKRFGTIVPHTESDVFATWHKEVGFSASLTVYNIEPSPITLTGMGVVPLSDNPDAVLPAPVFTSMKTAITIKAMSASALGVVISNAQLLPATKLGNTVPGFMIYYRGYYTQDGKTTPVLFSRTIRIPLNISGGAWLTDAGSASKLPTIPWDVVKASVFTVANDPNLKLTSDAASVAADDATQTVAVALDSMPHTVAAKSQARAAIDSGILSGIAGLGA